MSNSISFQAHEDEAKPRPKREVHCADAFQWLASNALPPSVAIVTSLPDSSELPSMGFEAWREWFSATTARLINAVHAKSVAIFFQTDVKREGTWVDKGYLCQRGAEQAEAALLWHKVVCRAPAGTATFGRPAYAHLLCFSKSLRLEPGRSTADVLPRLGEMPWSRAMGVEACRAACTFIKAETTCSTVLDPFCGMGTVLAVANNMGLEAIGVELSRKRVEKARALFVAP
ncbi:MAG: site-specific DNA-methyltransferase [Myxococcaceae bacterium]|nr:site-specific DNA-methyltransferase [Myxococcaceae bacterium]